MKKVALKQIPARTKRSSSASPVVSKRRPIPAKKKSQAKAKAGKTEVQALNAKLARINLQLHEKLAQLAGTTNDLSSLLNSTDIAVLFLDRQLRIRRFTPAVNDLLHLQPEDLGRPLAKFARKFTDPGLLADVRAVLKSADPMEAEIVGESGRVYLRRALPYRTASGQGFNGVVLTFIDITRLKLAETALRTSEERLRLILEGVADYAILILDEDGRFVTWSRSAERIFGFTANETLGRSLEILYPEEEKKSGTLDREMRKAKEQKSTPEERWHVRKDGGRFWGAGVFSALYDERGRMYGFVKVLRDDTARKNTDEALQKAKSAAEAANTAKDNFLANISHELRTPLSATLLWAKLLGTQQHPIPPEQLKEGLEAIEKSAKEQQALIEDLVDTSRMAVGKLRLEFKEFLLPALAETGLEMIRPTAIEKGVYIESNIDPKLGTVRADGLRLRQILGNLLTNAVKFTPQGGRVTLTMQRQGDLVELTVTDTGQGITAEFLPRVFDRFTQAEPSGIRLTSGLGLGLSIAKQLAELHGGTIGVSSDGLAKGSTFTVRLPLPKIAPARPSAPSLPGRATPSLRGLQLLLVEDDLETRRALQAVLSDAGAKISAVDSVQLALKDFNRRRPDLILSDIGLGKVSGHEFIRQIRQWEKAQKSTPVPALALTAYADERNRVEALESGFQQILIKPIDGPALISALLCLHALQ